MTFKAWLMQQIKRDDRVGNLARNVQKDRTWPPTQDMVKLRQYTRKRGVIAEKALEVELPRFSGQVRACVLGNTQMSRFILHRAHHVQGGVTAA